MHGIEGGLVAAAQALDKIELDVAGAIGGGECLG
jgi:hypothetical protein